jgi:Zn-dependent peptidase ImmA (M78 family)
MNVMNTTEKGNKLENIAFEILSEKIDNGELGLIPEQCEIEKNTKIYSKDRERFIRFDLTIKVTPPGAQRSTLLYLIECKNYESSVEPEKIEAFAHRISQIRAHKGVFITKNRVQIGTRNIAKNFNMMLIEVNDNTTANIILHKIKRHNKINQKKTLSDSDKIDIKIEGLIVGAFTEYLKRLSPENDFIELPRLSRNYIETFSEDLLRDIDFENITDLLPPDIPKILRKLNEIFGLSVEICDINKTDNMGREIESYCSLKDRNIVINQSLDNTKRFNFILAHELGHFFLHNKIQIKQSTYEYFEDSRKSFQLDKFLIENERNWIEWQANQFASSFILPSGPFKCYFKKFMEDENLWHKNWLYVDNQPCNLKTFSNITGFLANKFNTSKTSIIYRLNSVGLLKDNRQSSKFIGKIIRDLFVKE